MLGQPVSMLIPQVVGFKLSGELPGRHDRHRPGADHHRDAAPARRGRQVRRVLRPRRQRRAAGQPGHHRQHVARSTARPARSSRSTTRRSRYLRASPAAPREQVALVEAYAKEQGLWHDPAAEPGLLRAPRARPVARSSRRWPARSGPQDRVAADRRQDGVPGRAGRLRRRGSTGRTAMPQGTARPTRPATSRSRPATRRRPTARATRPTSRPTWSTAAAGASGRASQPDPGHRRGRHRASSSTTARVVIAAITSCTNTSNPQVMIGAALLARNAVDRGLTRKPWVKTTLAPGSKVVMDYYERAGLAPYLDKLGFNLVGYGCTTCIGNSGPLPDGGLRGGQRGRPGRRLGAVRQPQLRGPDQPGRQDELPGVAAAGGRVRAGRLDGRRPDQRAARHRPRRQPGLPARHLAEQRRGAGRSSPTSIRSRRCSRRDYADVFAGDERWQSLPTPDGRDASPGTTTRPTCASPRTSTACRASRAPVVDIAGARVLADARRLGHHRPHLARRRDQGGLPRRPLPHRARRRREGLQLLRVAPGQPRGDDPRHLRQHPAAQPARPRRRGRRHRRPPRPGEQMSHLRRRQRPTRPTACRW